MEYFKALFYYLRRVTKENKSVSLVGIGDLRTEIRASGFPNMKQVYLSLNWEFRFDFSTYIAYGHCKPYKQQRSSKQHTFTTADNLNTTKLTD